MHYYPLFATVMGAWFSFPPLLDVSLGERERKRERERERERERRQDEVA